jgi:2-polyprenyl-6-methoxyphenol hydroxylase-like FAD-dependent oxidoreductase
MGGYAGLAAVNEGLWNAAWSVPAAAVRAAGGDIDRIFREACTASAMLKRRFRNARRVGDWLACPLPRYAMRRGWPNGVIPIGNAAAALEPVGGEGMGLAMRSGELAAEAIDMSARMGIRVKVRQLQREFSRLWRTRRSACRGAAVALAHPLLGPLVVGAAGRSPLAMRAGLALIGK